MLLHMIALPLFVIGLLLLVMAPAWVYFGFKWLKPVSLFHFFRRVVYRVCLILKDLQQRFKSFIARSLRYRPVDYLLGLYRAFCI